jgi:hypothetical protein
VPLRVWMAASPLHHPARMTNRRRYWVVALALLGCAKKDDDLGGVALDSAPEEMARAVCPRAYDCCLPSQLMSNDQAGTDEASCETRSAAGFRNQLDGLQDSIKKKRARYRGDKLAACLAFIRSASCERLSRTDHFSGLECEPYVEPLLAVGATCGHDHECVDGVCQKEPMAWEGVCRPLAREAESCAAIRCGAGLTCGNGTCIATRAEGASCQSNPQCASGNCSAPVAGGAQSCAPAAANKCFYSSACAFGRSPPPAGLLLVALALAAYRLSRRGRAAG